MMAPLININIFVYISFSPGRSFVTFFLRQLAKRCQSVEKGMQTKTLMFVGGAMVWILTMIPHFSGFCRTVLNILHKNETKSEC